jgi:predicted MFS family arabinose efflux permease
LAFFIASLLAVMTVLVTIFFIKEKPGRSVGPPKKLNFDFLKYPSVIKFNLVVFFVYLGHGSLTPFFVKYCVGGLGLSENTANFSLLLLTVVGAAFAYPMGLLADKITRKRVMVLGILLYGLALLSGSFFKGSTALYVIMSIVGVGFVTIQVTSYAILAELVPPARLGEFMGIFNFFISISQFIANNTMGILLDRMGYSIFFPLAGFYVLMAALLLVTSRLQKHQDNPLEVGAGI